MISSVHVVYKLYTYRNIGLYITVRYSLSFFVILFFSPLVYSPILKKLKQYQKPLFIVRCQAGSAISFITRRGENDPRRPETFRRHTNVNRVRYDVTVDGARNADGTRQETVLIFLIVGLDLDVTPIMRSRSAGGCFDVVQEE